MLVLFLYLIKEMHGGERSVKYQGSSVSDTPALAGAGRGHCRGDIGRSKELPPPEALAEGRRWEKLG